METQTMTATECEFCNAALFNGKCIADDDFEDDEIAEIERMRIQDRIDDAYGDTAPKTKERNAALAGVRWVLTTRDERYATLNGMAAVLTSDITQATVFDARDNEVAKAKFYSAVVGEFLYAKLI